MKSLFYGALLSLATFALSCSGDGASLGTPVRGTDRAMSGFNNWWAYYTAHIKFYRDFSAFDTDARAMPVDSFMKKYGTGKYAVLKYVAADTIVQYKLEELPANADENISNMLPALAYADYQNFRRMGKPLPGFDYTDLDGRIFNAQTMKGKIVVLKFWFIGCQPCIEEMPELNRIVGQNRRRQDVVFLSLALDSENALRKFLARRRFDYAVVADKKVYLTDTLNIGSYPTHLLIDRNGKVAGIAGNVKDLKELLSLNGIDI